LEFPGGIEDHSQLESAMFLVHHTLEKKKIRHLRLELSGIGEREDESEIVESGADLIRRPPRCILFGSKPPSKIKLNGCFQNLVMFTSNREKGIGNFSWLRTPKDEPYCLLYDIPILAERRRLKTSTLSTASQ
jgi:hypothetical protein